MRMKASKVCFGLGISLFSLLSACADDALVDQPPGSDQEEIVGGTATTIDQVPFQVALETNSGFQFCGGSILSANWVLTAQHCVTGGNADMKVVAGVTRISQ